MNTSFPTGSFAAVAPPSRLPAPAGTGARSRLGSSPAASGDGLDAGPNPTPNVAELAPSVNLLQRAAAATRGGGLDASALLELPPLPPMPAPVSAPAVPTDDHGQSNIVFADADNAAAFIH